MERDSNSGKTISTLSKGILGAFTLSVLVAVYLLFMLPSDLQFTGNLQQLDPVIPVLIKLYIVLGIAAGLAVLAILTEMNKTKVAIVYKEKTASQIAEEKAQSESVNLESLDSKSIESGSGAPVVARVLEVLSKRLHGVAGASYLCKEENGARFTELVSGFALPLSESDVVRFKFGEGLVGQVAKNGSPIYMDDIPEGYFQAVSGLGQAAPKFILLLPIKKNNEVKGVIELATFKSISNPERQMVEKFAGEIGEKIS